MCKACTFRSYLIWFYIFGQNPCFPICSVKTVTFLSRIPCNFLFMWMVISVCIISIINVQIGHDASVFLDIFTFCAMLPNVFVFVASFFMPKTAKHLIDAYINIIDYSDRMLHIKIHLNQFYNEFGKKWKWTIIGCIISSILRLIFASPLYGRIPEMCITVLSFYKIIAIFHCTFFIDFSITLMAAINRGLEKNNIDYDLRWRCEPKKLIKRLYHLKLIHFKLWQCRRVINKRFGWILLTVFIDSIVIFTRSGYATFLFEQTYGQYLLLMTRNYFSFLHLFSLSVHTHIE